MRSQPTAIGDKPVESWRSSLRGVGEREASRRPASGERLASECIRVGIVGVEIMTTKRAATFPRAASRTIHPAWLTPKMPRRCRTSTGAVHRPSRSASARVPRGRARPSGGRCRGAHAAAASATDIEVTARAHHRVDAIQFFASQSSETGAFLSSASMRRARSPGGVPFTAYARANRTQFESS